MVTQKELVTQKSQKPQKVPTVRLRIARLPFAAQKYFCDFRDFCVEKIYLRILSGNPLQRKANFCDFRDFCVTLSLQRKAISVISVISV